MSKSGYLIYLANGPLASIGLSHQQLFAAQWAWSAVNLFTIWSLPVPYIYRLAHIVHQRTLSLRTYLAMQAAAAIPVLFVVLLLCSQVDCQAPEVVKAAEELFNAGEGIAN